MPDLPHRPFTQEVPLRAGVRWSVASVSSPRHNSRSVRISRATRSCTLLVKGYEPGSTPSCPCSSRAQTLRFELFHRTARLVRLGGATRLRMTDNPATRQTFTP